MHFNNFSNIKCGFMVLEYKCRNYIFWTTLLFSAGIDCQTICPVICVCCSDCFFRIAAQYVRVLMLEKS